MAKKTAKKTAKKISAKPPAAKRRDGLHMLIVEARYYEHIAEALLRGATAALEEAGATYDRIGVPGALEISAAIAMAVDAAARKRDPYDGVVALGCVILGETYHFEIVSNESARGLSELALSRQLPIGNGILTVENEPQAVARAGGNKGNKGAEAARAALAMGQLKRSLAGQ
jgi:6,7-dimethyl-8-ribityllumazine synthase